MGPSAQNKDYMFSNPIGSVSQPNEKMSPKQDTGLRLQHVLVVHADRAVQHHDPWGNFGPHGLGLRALDPKPKTRNSRAEPGFKGLLKGISRVL